MSSPRSYGPSLPVRRLAVLLLVLFATLVVSSSAPAPVMGQSSSSAPPEEVLVDNDNQTGGAGRDIGAATFDMAQAFTAGTHQHGYVLTSVKIRFSAIGTTASTFNVKVCTGSDSNPVSNCPSGHDLTLSGTLASTAEAVFHTFTASGGGIELTKGTTYYVVLTTTAAGVGSTVVSSTNSDNEDFQEIGWSIANGVLASTHLETTWTQFNDSLKMQVLGRAKESGAPTVESLEIDGTKLVATFDRYLDSSAAPAASQFGIKIGSGSYQNATAISVSGKRAVLTVPTVTSGQTVTARYTKPGSGNKLKDVDGNEVATYTDQAVTNLTDVDPSLTSAVVDGNRMTLTFDRSLKEDSGTAHGAFGYRVGGGIRVAAVGNSVVISGKQVRYEIVSNHIPRLDQTVTTEYGQPTSNKLKDAWENDVPAVSSTTATNISPLVSNLRATVVPPASFSSDEFDHDHSQPFTVGAGGVNLTAVELALTGESGSTASNFSVSIRSVGTNNTPGSTNHGTLTNPSELVVGRNTFTAPSGGIDLDAGTYILYVDSTQSVNLSTQLSTTSSDDEDRGASSGWSIANGRLVRGVGLTTWQTLGSSLMMAIRGGPKASSARKLVGNVVASASFGDNVSRDIHTQFTTGSQSFSLTRAVITVDTLGTPPTTYELELWSTGSGAAKLATFNKPSALAAGLNAFTLTTPESLSASTTYALVWDQGEAASTFRLGRAGNYHEDSDGLTGWSITNGSSRRAHNSTAAFGSPSGSVSRFALYGTETAAGPAAPQGLTAQGGDGQVVLNWTDPSDSTITGYQIRQSTDGGSTWSAWTDVPSSGATTTTHTVSSLTNGTKYTFELRAVAGTDNGAAASVSATPAGQLVKNLNKNIGTAAGTNIVTNDAAQAFTTGSHDAGFKLSYVILGAGGSGTPPGPSGYSVKVCNNDSSGSSHVPGTTCTDLTEPAALSGGGNTFTASGAGIDLTEGTTYWVVFDSASGGSGTFDLRRTDDNGEDSGAASGFTIHDAGLTRARAVTAWSTAHNPQKIGIYGYTKTGPPAPTGLQAAAGDGQVTLTWTNPGNTAISKYQYRQSTDGGTNWPAWTDIPGSGAGTTSHTVGSLTNGTAYTFQVRAVIDQGNTPGTASANVSATPRQQPPAAPSGLSAQAGDTQVRLTWTNPGDSLITKYQYRVSADGGTNWSPNWTDVSGSGAGTTSYTVTGLTNGTTYRIELRAVRGTSNAGPAASVTAVAGVPPPATPTGLRATAGDTQASLRWNNPGNSAISKYQYRVSADGGSSWSPDWTDISGSGATTTSYTVTGLTNGTTYRIELRAVRGTSNAGPSAATSATPGQPPPATPMGLTVTAGQGGITLRWSNPGDSSIVRYEYSLDGSTWIPIPNSGPGTTSYTIAGVTIGSVRLRAVNASGAGSGFLVTSRPVVAGGRLVLVAVYDTVGWRRFESRFGDNCWDEMEAAIAAAQTSSGRTPEGDELALCQRFLAEDIRDVEYVWRVVR